MARERSIVVRLKAEVSGFTNEMNKASRSLSDFEKGQQKLGGAADTTLGRLVQSARINEREWTNVGQTMAVAGGAITGIGIAALKTGIQYNTLQQTSRAALTTIMGTAEGANRQMDKLDDFARNSPFAKQVFIEAQQQMLGFGIEAQKVIPYLGAIQDAVAATGGSNEDIAELSRVFSTVQANAKLTARDLMMFGQRGVDAAGIIGEQMGKTGGQIRSEITAGTLDAGEALDALAAGMSERFGGAAANVKDTFEGAWDRVKAAWRDLSSALATPLVDPQGGGALIDFFNMLADAMRGLEAAPTWLQGTIVAIGALAGAGLLLGGTLLMAIPRVAEFSASMRTLADTHPRLHAFTSGFGEFTKTVGRVAGLGAQIGILATAIGALFTAATTDTDFHGLNTLRSNIEDLVDAGKTAQEIDLGSIVSELPTTFGMVKIEAENLGDVFEKMLNPSTTDKFADFFSGVLPTYMENNREIAQELDAALTQMLNAGGAEEAAAVQFIENLGLGAEDLKIVLPEASDAMVGIEEAAEGSSAAADAFADGLAEVGLAADGTVESLNEYLDMLFATGLAHMGEQEAQRRHTEAINDFDAMVQQLTDDYGSLSGAIDENTGLFSTSTEIGIEAGRAFDNIAEAGMNSAKAMAEAGASQEEVQGSLNDTYDALVEAAGAFVETDEEADALARSVLGIPEEVDVETWMDDQAKILAEELAESIDGLPEDIFIETDADTEPALKSHSDFLNHVLGSSADTSVDADTKPASDRVRGMLDAWGAERTDTNLGANTSPATSTYDTLMAQWGADTTETNLDANTHPAMAGFNSTTGIWEGTTTATNLDANTGPAAGAFAGVTNTWAATTTTTSINADTTPAQRAWNNFKSGVGAIYTSIVATVTGGNYHGGFVNPGRYTGGQVLPGRRAGGWVPGERAGYDNVMWPLHAGGQVLTQPLEGGEFVVRSSQAPNYTPELYAMNNGTFPTGIMERLYSSNAAGPTIVQVPAPTMPSELTGKLYLDSGALLGEVRMAVKDQSVVRQQAQQLASLDSRDRRGRGGR